MQASNLIHDLISTSGTQFNYKSADHDQKVVVFPTKIVAFENRDFALPIAVLKEQIGNKKMELFLVETKLTGINSIVVSMKSAPSNREKTEFLNLEKLLPQALNFILPTRGSLTNPSTRSLNLSLEKVMEMLIERRQTLLDELVILEVEVRKLLALQSHIQPQENPRKDLGSSPHKAANS